MPINSALAKPLVTIAVLLFFTILRYSFVNLWVRAIASNVKVGLVDIFMMRFRKVDAKVIVYGLIRAVKAGPELNTKQLEAHYLAGGSVERVVNSLIMARAVRVDLAWDEAAAADLAGRDMCSEMETAVTQRKANFPAIESA